MTVESAKNKAGPFNVTGTSGTFPRDFLLLDEDHLRVIRVRDGAETDLTSGIGHTGIGTADGTVVISTGIQSGDQIYLLRAVPNLQRSDYNAQGRVRTEQVESDFDLAIMQVQDLREAQDRALTLPVSSEIGGEEAMAAALAAPQYAAEAKESAEAAAASAARLNGAIYSSRDELAAAAPSLLDGMTVLAGGEPYIIDSTATGYDSALQDLGIDGVRRPSEVRNVYLSAFFTNQNDNTVHLCVSLDGVNFSTINAGVLPIPGGGGLSIRDPAITWYAGEWWIFATGAAVSSHDFVVFRSRDLLTWSKRQCSLGGGPYYSETTPFPGGSAPCNSIWAPEPFVENGRLYIAIAVRYGADITDAFGNTIFHRVTVISELTDPVAMTFSVPQILDMDGETAPLIDMSICKVGSTYWGAVKDDAAKTIQIRSASSLLGPWVLNQTISDTQRSIEAPCLTPFYTKGLNSDAVVAGWRLYVDNNRTGPGASDPNVLVGRPYFATVTGDPGGTWSSLTPAYFDVPVRHGSVVNMASLPPEAMRSLEQAVVGRTQQRPALTAQVPLGSGSVTIRPQPDVTYYVEGAGNDVALSIEDGPADRFWLGVWAGDPATGITVSGGYVPRPFLLGYGRGNDIVIEMRRRGTDGQYYPSGQVCRSEFLANKGGTAQAVAGATNVTVTWPTEVYDRGGHFASNGWTPPRGIVSIVAGVTMSGTDAGENNRISILKNGNPIQTAFAPGVAGANVSLKAVVEGETANGTDVFTVQVRGNGAGAKSVSGIAAETFFHGVAW